MIVREQRLDDVLELEIEFLLVELVVDFLHIVLDGFLVVRSSE